MWHHLIRHVFATFYAGTQVLLLSLPQPSVPYKHTKLSVRASSSRHTPVLWHQPGVRLPMTTRGPQIGDIINPQAEGAKQLAPTEEDLSHVSWDSNYSNLMVILERAKRDTKRGRECTGTFEKLIDFTTLEFRSAPPFLSTLPPSFHLKCLWTAVGIWVQLTHHPAG